MLAPGERLLSFRPATPPLSVCSFVSSPLSSPPGFFPFLLPLSRAWGGSEPDWDVAETVTEVRARIPPMPSGRVPLSDGFELTVKVFRVVRLQIWGGSVPVIAK